MNLQSEQIPIPGTNTSTKLSTNTSASLGTNTSTKLSAGRLRNTDGNTTDVYTYDAAGNIISNTDRDIASIQYDHRNLAHLILTGDGLHRYLYNSEGLRTGKQYKPQSSGSWTVNTRYVRGAYGELLAQYAVSGQNHTLQYHNINTPTGEPLGRLDADTETRYYYLKDHLSSVRVTIDDEGDIVGYDDYFPFGMQMSGRSWNQGNVFDDQKFTGHFLESEGGLGIYHAGARMYDPEVPRFYGVDAMRGEMPGWNPYQYSFNNPVRFFDPDGNHPYEFHVAEYDPETNIHTITTSTRDTVSETVNEDGTITREYTHTTTTTTVHRSPENAKVTVGETVKTQTHSTVTYTRQEVTEGGSTVTRFTPISTEATGTKTITGAKGSTGHQSMVASVRQHQHGSGGPFQHDPLISGRTQAYAGTIYAAAQYIPAVRKVRDTYKLSEASQRALGLGTATHGLYRETMPPANRIFMGRTRK